MALLSLKIGLGLALHMNSYKVTSDKERLVMQDLWE